MPIPDDDTLGPGLERRLKAALDEVRPPSPALAAARYRMGATRPLRAWRFAPALVAVVAAGAVITATAATGSPNPAIWKDRAGTAIQNVGHFPGSSPKATHSPKPQPRESPEDRGTGTGRPTPSSTRPPEPRESPEPSEHPEASPTPDSSGRGDGSDGPRPSPTPSGDDGD